MCEFYERAHGRFGVSFQNVTFETAAETKEGVEGVNRAEVVWLSEVVAANAKMAGSHGLAVSVS